MNYTILAALAEPNRLRIVELLRERPYSVNEMAQRLQLRQPQVSKHMQALDKAGLVVVYPIAQQRFYGLKPDYFKELSKWTQTFQPFWDTESSIRKIYLQSMRDKRTPITTSRAFKISRTFHAPNAAVWEAWTKPELLKQWWAPDYFTIATCELDVRVGGGVRIDMRAPDGAVFSMAGKYTQIDQPRQLSLVTSSLDTEGNKLFELQLTATLAEHNQETQLTVEAQILSATPRAAQYLSGLQPGWEQNLAKLDQLLQITGGEPVM